MCEAKVLAVLVESSRFVPALRDTGVILPFMEKAQMLGIRVVERNHGEGLIKMGDPSTIDDRARRGFGWSNWVP